MRRGNDRSHARLLGLHAAAIVSAQFLPLMLVRELVDAVERPGVRPGLTDAYSQLKPHATAIVGVATEARRPREPDLPEPSASQIALSPVALAAADGQAKTVGGGRTPSERSPTETKRMLGALAGGCVLAAAVAAAGAIGLGLSLDKRLAAIAAIAEAMSPPSTAEPVSPKASEANLLRIERALERASIRMAIVSGNARDASALMAHDLRTPLTRVRSVLDVALLESSAASMRKSVERALAGCDDLAELLASLLRIADIERGPAGKHATEVDAVEVVELLHDAYEPALSDGGRSLSLICDGPAPIMAERTLLIQALANLLDNAQLHTPPGTNVVVSVQPADGKVAIVVSDDGPGVSSAALPRLTERFFRADRDGGPSGHGLGLSMAAAVAEAHDGRVVISNDGPGLRVALTFAEVGREG